MTRLVERQNSIEEQIVFALPTRARASSEISDWVQIVSLENRIACRRVASLVPSPGIQGLRVRWFFVVGNTALQRRREGSLRHRISVLSLSRSHRSSEGFWSAKYIFTAHMTSRLSHSHPSFCFLPSVPPQTNPNSLHLMMQHATSPSRSSHDPEHSRGLQQDTPDEPLPQLTPDHSLGIAPLSSDNSAEVKVAKLLNLSLPPNSPPLHRDLFVQSVFSTAASPPSAKPVARLETVIHTTPEKLKEYFTDFSSSSAASKGVNAVAQERKENGEYTVAYKIQGNEVSRRAHARAL